MVPTIADATDEPNNKVSVRLISEDTGGGGSATYSIGANPVIEADIHDNDDPALPSFNITAVNSSVTEAAGAKARFNVTATVGTSGDTTPIDIQLDVSEEGNFLANAAGIRSNISVTPGVAGSETPTVHEEDLNNDSNHRTDGMIVAKIVNSTAYGVGANASCRSCCC